MHAHIAICAINESVRLGPAQLSTLSVRYHISLYQERWSLQIWNPFPSSLCLCAICLLDLFFFASLFGKVGDTIVQSERKSPLLDRGSRKKTFCFQCFFPPIILWDSHLIELASMSFYQPELFQSLWNLISAQKDQTKVWRMKHKCLFQPHKATVEKNRLTIIPILSTNPFSKFYSHHAFQTFTQGKGSSWAVAHLFHMQVRSRFREILGRTIPNASISLSLNEIDAVWSVGEMEVFNGKTIPLKKTKINHTTE